MVRAPQERRLLPNRADIRLTSGSCQDLTFLRKTREKAEAVRRARKLARKRGIRDGRLHVARPYDAPSLRRHA